MRGRIVDGCPKMGHKPMELADIVGVLATFVYI